MKKIRVADMPKKRISPKEVAAALGATLWEKAYDDSKNGGPAVYRYGVGHISKFILIYILAHAKYPIGFVQIIRDIAIWMGPIERAIKLWKKRKKQAKRLRRGWQKSFSN